MWLGLANRLNRIGRHDKQSALDWQSHLDESEGIYEVGGEFGWVNGWLYVCMGMRVVG